MKTLLHSEICHGFIILLLLGACLGVHSVFSKKDPTTEVIGLYGVLSFGASIAVYRLIINPLL